MVQRCFHFPQTQPENDSEEVHLDAVLAYDRIAPQFSELSKRRRAYLSGIERLILSEMRRASRSLLDIGAGDGTRAYRIAQAAGIKHLVLLEPSAEMRRYWRPDVVQWPIKAEQLGDKQGSFDIITCLWNVLGHISPAASRVAVLRHCARLLSSRGLLFLDVNNRYNAPHYGLLPTAFRIVRDTLRPNVSNGDVTVRWNVNGITYTTDGHVFTQREMHDMAYSAGLMIVKQFTVDYATGEASRWRFAGNPLYLLRRAASASPNA